MKGYSYNEFLEDLNRGHEIHFIYKEENYYIRGQNFWKFNDADSEIAGEDTNELLQKVRLEGKTLMELWNIIEINIIF